MDFQSTELLRIDLWKLWKKCACIRQCWGVTVQLWKKPGGGWRKWEIHWVGNFLLWSLERSCSLCEVRSSFSESIGLRFQVFIISVLSPLHAILKRIYIYICGIIEVSWDMQICLHLEKRLKNWKHLERWSGKRDSSSYKLISFTLENIILEVTVLWFTVLNSTLSINGAQYISQSSVFLQNSAFSVTFLFCSPYAIWQIPSLIF